MNYLELIGTFVGLVYLWLEYKASLYLWVASIIMPAVYIVIYYQAGLYADLGINIYYVLASVYGLACWMVGKRRRSVSEHVAENINEIQSSSRSDRSRNESSLQETFITETPRKLYLPLIGITVMLTILFAALLIRFTDSNVPWADSFTTALSVVALWMLAKKYVEQWLAWILVDIVCAVLYIYKGLYFTSGLYTLYTLIAYFGYLKWKKMMKDQQ